MPGVPGRLRLIEQVVCMKLMIVPVTPFQQNCSILIDETSDKAVAIDPGGDLDQIDEALASTGATLEKVLLTHGHIDHCGLSRLCLYA